MSIHKVAETISVNAKNLDNTILVEFSNNPNNTLEIKTIKVWLGGDKTFKSFKTETGWEGGTYSDGKLLVFTAVDSLKSGESVIFSLVTNQKVTGINWKASDKNDNVIDTNKTPIQKSSEGCDEGTVLVNGVCQLAPTIKDKSTSMSIEPLYIVIAVIAIGGAIVGIFAVKKGSKTEKPVKQKPKEEPKEEPKKMAPFCSQCGTQYRTDAKFCGKCGNQV